MYILVSVLLTLPTLGKDLPTQEKTDHSQRVNNGNYLNKLLYIHIYVYFISCGVLKEFIIIVKLEGFIYFCNYKICCAR